MNYKKKRPKVAIIMGSQSDYLTMKLCQKVLKRLKIKYETKIVSAHRTPDRMYEFAKSAEKNGDVRIKGRNIFNLNHTISSKGFNWTNNITDF